ncbi:hypothetical protein SAMN05192529_102137 [Arachidicoccus rhizosphaerae]|uniref:Uncharacterized protein n=1 Tax=Arachidicoccus rhizosphaerae TaxID=551991 RepID=A0A1H3W4Z2_9BACT|nr:hypothetical protein [Arachidicoccus rhizosphaerae]SDZ82147.1 hypothetical protein SAMN05192529_102137 [Arachidicoccus rhizosphaerae]
MKIKIGKKEAVLSFGMICWEQVQAYLLQESAVSEGLSDEQKVKRNRTANSRNISNLIMAAIANEEEITGQEQGFTYDEVFRWVISSGVTEEGYKAMRKVDEALSNMFVYKEFIKTADNIKKKAMIP